MFGIASVVLLGVAFVLNGIGAHSDSAWFTPTSFMLAGLTCLAVHLLSVGGSSWRFTRS